MVILKISYRKEEDKSMRFTTKIPKANEKLSKKLVDEGWKRLKEPKNLAMDILVSVPIMLINIFISIFIISRFYNPIAKIISARYFSFTIKFVDILYFILAVFMLIIVHELLHIVFVPNFMKSNKTYLGINLNGGFTYTSEEMSKARFIIISIMPFLVLSIFSPIILGIFNVINGFISFFIILNAGASSVDILNLFLVLFQVPKKAYIINNGVETYFE